VEHSIVGEYLLANSFPYAMLMLAAGFSIPVMASLNSGLSVQLGSSALVTVILFVVGFLASFVYLLATQGMPNSIFNTNIPWYFYCGGLLVAFYILGITWVAPRFGVGNAVSFVLLGQLIAMSLIDHFGWFGAPQLLITTTRAIGILFMMSGVFLVVR
jgi:bacterial/archaeal transporter family-2 protein